MQVNPHLFDIDVRHDQRNHKSNTQQARASLRINRTTSSPPRQHQPTHHTP